MEKSAIAKCTVMGHEKRRDGGKHYVYRIKVEYMSEKVDMVWRRYSQFDALKATLAGLLKRDDDEDVLPKLTPKKYLGRSSVRNVAQHRLPRLQEFLDELLRQHGSNVAVMSALTFFLTPNATDSATKLRAGTDDAADDSDDGIEAVVLADLPGVHDGELSVAAGDRILVYSTDRGSFKRPDGDWVMAATREGTRGLVRFSQVKIDTKSAAGKPQPKVASATAELVHTERQYRDNLVEVRDNFFPLIRTILTAPEAKCLFGNWAELIQCSEEMLAAFESSPNNEVEVLLKMLPRLQEPYSKYCQGIPAAQQLYEKKLLEKKFINFEQSFEELNKPTLNHFMRPVQRIMKYPLLISEIKKAAVKAGTETGTDMSEAVDIATSLANEANANMNRPVESMGKSDISGPQSGTFVYVKGVQSEPSNLGKGGSMKHASRAKYVASSGSSTHLEVVDEGQKSKMRHTEPPLFNFGGKSKSTQSQTQPIMPPAQTGSRAPPPSRKAPIRPTFERALSENDSRAIQQVSRQPPPPPKQHTKPKLDLSVTATTPVGSNAGRGGKPAIPQKPKRLSKSNGDS